MIKAVTALFFTWLVFSSEPAQTTGIKTGSDNPRYYYELARIHERYGFHDDAIECYLKAIEIDAADDAKQKYLPDLGKAYFNAGEFEQAESIMKDAINAEKVPTRRAEHYLVLAEIYEKLGDNDKVIESYEAVMKKAMTEIQGSMARQKLIRFLSENQRLDEYISELEARIENDPDDLTATRCLAFALISGNGDPEKAIPLYEKLFEHMPDDKTLANRLVQQYNKAGRHRDAAIVYERLLLSAPEQAYKLYFERISGLYAEAGLFEEALKWNRKLLEADTSNGYTYLRLADRYNSLGEKQYAEEMYINALNKVSRLSEKGIIAIKLIDFYLYTEEYEKAMTIIDEYLEKEIEERIAKELRNRAVRITARLDEKNRHVNNKD